MTQCERIVKYLDDFGSITTIEAFSELGIARLASRIHDLREAGYDIKAEHIKTKNRYGNIVYYARYRLADTEGA